ncbi:hypothetical protein IAD21_04879 [Abditibacteriota bacterium]|nr:hypothetical protein IAD21_04879 [Abditibacteriota bacterium]
MTYPNHGFNDEHICNLLMKIPSLLRGLTWMGVALMAASASAHATTFTVSNLNDSGVGSLRQTVLNANGGTGDDTIIFAPALTGTLTLTSGEITITDGVTITGPGANVLTVSGNDVSRILNVQSGIVTISELTLARGRVIGANGAAGTLRGQAGGAGGEARGGALYNTATLTLTNITLSDNQAVGGKGGTGAPGIRDFFNGFTIRPGAGGKGGRAFGGAIFNRGALTFKNTLLKGNQAIGGNGGNGGSPGTTTRTAPGGVGGEALGGAIYNGGVFQQNAIVFQNNRAVGGAGGVASNNGSASPSGAVAGNDLRDFPPAAADATFSGFLTNAFNGQLQAQGDNLTYSIVVGTLPAGLTLDGTTGLISGTPSSTANGQIVIYQVSDGFRASNRATITFNITGPIPVASNVTFNAIQGRPFLGQLSAMGYALTYSLAPPSQLPAGLTLDTTTGLITGTPTTIVQGFTAQYKVNDGFQDSNVATITFNIRAVESQSLVVTTLSDTSTDSDGVTSLREAISYANISNADDVIITFAPSLRGTITLNGTQLDISHDMTIAGPGAKVLAISGNHNSRIVDIDEATVSISGLSFINGKVLTEDTTAFGGALQSFGTLTLSACVFLNNEVTGNGAFGGAMVNRGTLLAQGCTFSSNVATGLNNSNCGGGAIGNAGTLVLLNCTVTNNKSLNGGGISNGAGMTVQNCTFAGNPGGSIHNNGDITQKTVVSNTIFNETQTSIAGTKPIVDNGYNLSRDAGGGFLSAITDRLNTEPLLGPLQDNGGPTPTFALLEGSPAINAGQSDLKTDQRGLPRPAGGAADIGAFEQQTAFLPVIGMDSPSVREGNGDTGTPAQLVFTLTLSKASPQPILVIVQSANTTTSPATAKSDYVPLGKTRVTFAPGETSHTVPITIVGDTIYEEDERVVLLLGTPVGATLGQASAEGSILNDDASPSLSINDVNVTEGNAGYTKAIFTVTLSSPSSRTTSVGYSTLSYGRGVAIGGTSSTPNVDYLAASGTLTFLPGQTSKTVVVYIKGDPLVEGNEPFLVRLSSPVNARLSDGIGLGTIQNDDSVSPADISPSDSASGGNS